jgi:hypothetical protein
MRANIGYVLAVVLTAVCASSASAATVQCGHGWRNGIPFAHVSLTITARAMNGISRPGAHLTRCELAGAVAEQAAQPRRNVRRFGIAQYWVGLYRCRFTQTTQQMPLGPSPLAEWVRCSNTGRYPNTVRFMVLELGQRQALASEREGEKEEPGSKCGPGLGALCG